VEGRIQTRSWEDKDGKKRFATEIVAIRVQFMPDKNGANVGTKEAQQFSADSLGSDSRGAEHFLEQGNGNITRFPPKDTTEVGMDSVSPVPGLNEIPF
jgi:single-strand DNA-binding protein